MSLATAGFMFLLAGGCAAVHESRPVKGAEVTFARKPDGSTEQTFRQGENPDTKSVIRKDDRGLVIEMGTSFAPLLAIPPAPDYTRYMGLGIAALMVAGGIAAASYLGPLGAQIGSRLVLFGAAAMVLSLTVGDWGWLYAGGLALLGLYCAWEKSRSWRSGFETPNPDITEEQRAAAAKLARKPRSAPAP